MKKIDNIVRSVLISWGIMLLFIAMWLGNKYPETQQDLLLIVRVYIGLVTIFVISRIILGIVKRKSEHS